MRYKVRYFQLAIGVGNRRKQKLLKRDLKEKEFNPRLDDKRCRMPFLYAFLNVRSEKNQYKERNIQLSNTLIASRSGENKSWSRETCWKNMKIFNRRLDARIFSWGTSGLSHLHLIRILFLNVELRGCGTKKARSDLCFGPWRNTSFDSNISI